MTLGVSFPPKSSNSCDVPSLCIDQLVNTAVADKGSGGLVEFPVAQSAEVTMSCTRCDCFVYHVNLDQHTGCVQTSDALLIHVLAASLIFGGFALLFVFSLMFSTKSS